MSPVALDELEKSRKLCYLNNSGSILEVDFYNQNEFTSLGVSTKRGCQVA